MRVAVNATPLLTPRSGVGNYVYYLFKAMSSLPAAPHVSYYYGGTWGDRLRERPSALYDRSRRAVKRIAPARWMYRTAVDQLFRWGATFRRFDLYHETNFVPLPFAGPTLVTVFDLSFLLYPETHPADRLKYMEKRFYPRLDRVRHFITISEAVKAEMVRHLGLDPNRISVTPLGVDPSFRPLPLEDVEPVLRGYGLRPYSYVLCVGTLEPRKNVMGLLEAYALLPKDLRERCPLVLTGGEGWLLEGLDRLCAKLGVAENLVMTGFVPDAALVSLMNGAGVFAFPSLYEGFGLPPAEAMSCGAPVVCSDIPALSEVVGDGGVLLPSRDVGRWRDEMEAFLTDPRRRESFRDRATQRARRFSWDQCAAATLRVYEFCLS